MENQLNPYYPLTQEEYIHLRNTMAEITTHLPDNLTGYIWGTFNRLRDTHEPQPCTCASAGGHWKRAIEHINEWLKEKA